MAGQGPGAREGEPCVVGGIFLEGACHLVELAFRTKLGACDAKPLAGCLRNGVTGLGCTRMFEEVRIKG